MEPVEIVLHHREGFGIKLFFLVIGQLVLGCLDQVAEVRQTESPAFFKKCAEFLIFLIQVEKSIQITAVDLMEMVADIAVGGLSGDPCAERRFGRISG